MNNTSLVQTSLGESFWNGIAPPTTNLTERQNTSPVTFDIRYEHVNFFQYLHFPLSCMTMHQWPNSYSTGTPTNLYHSQMTLAVQKRAFDMWDWSKSYGNCRLLYTACIYTNTPQSDVFFWTGKPLKSAPTVHNHVQTSLNSYPHPIC
jgi:hypothetical protein